MARAVAKILNPGRLQILKAVAGISAFVPHSFKVGDSAAFAPQPQEQNPRGSLVYEGSANLMQVFVQNNSTIRYSVTIADDAGPFQVGNAVFYGQNSTGEVLPFVMITLPFPVTKQVSSYSIGDGTYPVPGNRFMLSVTIHHDLIDTDEDAAVVVEVLTPEFANLAFFETEASVPASDLNPYAQFVVLSHLLTNNPTFVTKGEDGRYWATPFLKDLRHPKYNVLDGGISGDNYKDETLEFLWGHRFETTDSAYSGIVGGADFNSDEAMIYFTTGSTF